MRLINGPYDGFDLNQPEIEQLVKVDPGGFVFLPPYECLEAIQRGEMSKDDHFRDRICYAIEERGGERIAVYDAGLDRFLNYRRRLDGQ